MSTSEFPARLNRAVHDAADRAYREREPGAGVCIAVYVDVGSEPENVYVRDSKAAKPPGTKVHCIAQWYTGTTVQIRYGGGRSDWKNFWIT